MFLFGIDVEASSVNVSVVYGARQQTIATAQYPETERGITALQPSWAKRVLNNKMVGAHQHNIGLGKHNNVHMPGEGQGGIVSAFRYGLDIKLWQ